MDVLLPAAVLVVNGAELVVVGSAAMAALGIAITPKDLDIVPDPNAGNLEILREGIRHLGVVGGSLPRRLWADVHSVRTSFGPIDVLIRRGREEYPELRRSAQVVSVSGVPVACGALGDVLRLRQSHKVDMP